VCAPACPRGINPYHGGMIQASQTFRKEKAPSVDALKGLGMFVATKRFCLEHRPLRGIFQTAMTSIEVISMQQSCMRDDPDQGEKRVQRKKTHVMAPIMDQAAWNTAP